MLAVVGVAAVVAVVSYEHASALVREHGESGWTGRLIPLTVDGLVYAGSMAAVVPSVTGRFSSSAASADRPLPFRWICRPVRWRSGSSAWICASPR